MVVHLVSHKNVDAERISKKFTDNMVFHLFVWIFPGQYQLVTITAA